MVVGELYPFVIKKNKNKIIFIGNYGTKVVLVFELCVSGWSLFEWFVCQYRFCCMG